MRGGSAREKAMRRKLAPQEVVVPDALTGASVSSGKEEEEESLRKTKGSSSTQLGEHFAANFIHKARK
jgi:hypothetical protein